MHKLELRSRTIWIQIHLSWQSNRSSKDLRVRRFKLKSWTLSYDKMEGKISLPTRSSILALLGALEKWQQYNGNSVVLVHCRFVEWTICLFIHNNLVLFCKSLLRNKLTHWILPPIFFNIEKSLFEFVLIQGCGNTFWNILCWQLPDREAKNRTWSRCVLKY